MKKDMAKWNDIIFIIFHYKLLRNVYWDQWIAGQNYIVYKRTWQIKAV